MSTYDGLPPGPRWPIAQAAGYVLRPTGFLERCRARYGPRFTVRIPTQPPFVFLADVDDIRAVFTGPADVLHPGEAVRVLAALTGENSLNVLDEDAHLVQRRLMLPAFHGERMAALASLMAGVTEGEIAQWPLGEPIGLKERLRSLTLGVILRTIFGSEPQKRLDTLGELFTRLVTRPQAYVPALQRDYGLYKGFSRWLALREQADAYVYEMIDERRRGGGRGEDVLAMLLAARHEDGSPSSDQELRDQIMTLVLAGHETSSTQLAWAFAFLAHEREARERVVAEIDGGEGDSYLTATVYEVMRRRPVLDPPFPRLVIKPFAIGDRTYPPGVCLVPSAYLVHHDPAIYPEPYAFRPERFLDSQPGSYTFLAFGGGRRRCIGASFALVEMKVVLRAVLARLGLQAATDELEPTLRKGPTLVPRRGGVVTFTARRSPPAAATSDPMAAYS